MAEHSEAAEVRPFPTPAQRTTPLDRVPPHNLEAEASVLGSMLLSKNAIADVSEILRPEDFYRGAHRTIFEAMRELYNRGEPIDAVTLTDELDRKGLLDDVGGSPAIAEIVSRVPTAANAVYYGKIVADHALRRRLIDAGGEIARIGFEHAEDAAAAVDSAESLMYEVGQRGIRSEFVPMRDLLTESFAQIERLHENNSAITGLETGFFDFDELTAGLQPTNLLILAARPAMGKCLRGSESVLDPATGALHRISDLVAAGAGGTVASLGPDRRLRPALVSAVHDNGVQPVFEMTTRVGHTIGATANHPFLTAEGWVALADLAPGDRIAVPRALPYFGNEELPDSEVIDLADAVTGSVPAAVFRLARSQVALFLRRLLAPSGSAAPGDLLARGGERLTREVQHLLLRFGVIAHLRSAFRGAGGTRGDWELRIEDPVSVQRFGEEIAGAGRELTAVGASGRLRYSGVRPPSGPALAELAPPEVYWDEIVAIEPTGEERVYDLTVPGDHNFVASDIIVHNSTLVTNIATHVAVELRQPVVMFSLEMSQMELVHRILAAEAKVNSEKLRTGRLDESDWPKLSQAMGRLAEAKLFIDDTPGINLMEIRSKCRRLKQRHGLSLVIVDYLQLMQSHGRVENRVQEVSQLSRGLKILAKELELPVLALSQLSRRPEERTDRRPQLSDLRESGSLEQDADIVAFIYRDEVYNPDSDAKGEAELIVSKHRNGALRTIRLSFLGHHSRFANMARGPMQGRGGGPL